MIVNFYTGTWCFMCVVAPTKHAHTNSDCNFRALLAINISQMLNIDNVRRLISLNLTLGHSTDNPLRFILVSYFKC